MMVALRLLPSKQCTSTEEVGASMAEDMNCDAAAKCADRSSCVTSLASTRPYLNSPSCASCSQGAGGGLIHNSGWFAVR